MGIENQIANAGFQAGNNIQRTVGNALAEFGRAQKEKEERARIGEQAQAKAEHEFFSNGISQLLKMPEEQRPNGWKGLYEGAARNGFDVSGFPEYSKESLYMLVTELGGQVPDQQSVSTPYSKINPKDYTSESLSAFSQTGDYTALQPRVEPQKPVDNFDNETKLRNEFTKLSNDYVKQNAAFGRIQAAANEPSAAGDMALIFNYMKLLDPGSTVREGEFQQAAASGAFGDRIKAAVQQIASGERLAGAQRADFYDRSQRLLEEATRQHSSNEQQYRELAQRNRLDPGNVVIDYRAADPSREVNLNSAQDRKTLNGANYIKINGQWYQE